MQSEEMMKKLADNFGTLVMVNKRHPSSMSRLKNLLISEGVSETSARRKIADLDTGAGCLVKEEYGSLKLNQKLLSQMFLQIQSDLNIPNHFEEEYKKQLAELERKHAMMKKDNKDEINALVEEIERKNNIIKKQKEDTEKEKELLKWGEKFNWERYKEASGKLEVAEEKIVRMKKGIFSYLRVCHEDRRAARLEKKRIKREAKARQKHYAELERKWEKERQEEEKKKREQERARKKSSKKNNNPLRDYDYDEKESF